MLVKSTKNIASFIAGDKTIIKEILHPKNDGLDLEYSLAHATVKPGKASEPHILKKQSELYYILHGEGRVWVDGKQTDLSVGDLVLIPTGATQYIENKGNTDLVFLCIVSPPWKKEEEEIIEADI